MNTGGPAFPKPKFMEQAVRFEQEEGLSIRDYFAAKVMQGLLSANTEMYLALVEKSKKNGSISELSYYMADAMLKAREQ